MAVHRPRMLTKLQSERTVPEFVPMERVVDHLQTLHLHKMSTIERADALQNKLNAAIGFMVGPNSLVLRF
jgi:hypothetical protein